MTPNIQLIIPFDGFKEQIDSLIKEAGELYHTKIDSEEDLNQLKEKTKAWIDKSLNALSVSFNINDNDYVSDFRYANPNAYLNMSGVKEPLAKLTSREKDIIQVKQKSLWDTLRILSVSDAIIYPDKIDKKQRENYTVNEKLSILLDKLYQLYDDSYYPVRTILTGNAIVLKRYDDDRDLSQMLEDRGLLTKIGMEDGVNAQLTAEGAMFVENNRVPVKENYEEIRKTPEELERKIDEIIEKLTQLGFGQEIIFDELEELKNLYTSMNKKTWGQLLKGKLVDLAIGKVIENDTIKYIYEKLTDHQLHLP